MNEENNKEILHLRKRHNSRAMRNSNITNHMCNRLIKLIIFKKDIMMRSINFVVKSSRIDENEKYHQWVISTLRLSLIAHKSDCEIKSLLKFSCRNLYSQCRCHHLYFNSKASSQPQRISKIYWALSGDCFLRTNSSIKCLHEEKKKSQLIMNPLNNIQV